jgi:hypothetical protein
LAKKNVFFAQKYDKIRRLDGIYRKEDVLFQPKIRGASEKFKNQPRPLLSPRSVNFRQNFRNLSRKTVPLRPESEDEFLNVPPMGFEPVPKLSESLTTQFLNFCQHKLGPIIIAKIKRDKQYLYCCM